MSKYSLVINFENLEELSDFITIYNKINQKTENKGLKTTSDKRGSKTITLHQKAKEYRISHPELSYRDCLVEVSKQEPKQEPQETKPELIQIDEIPEQEQKHNIEIYEENICI
jgi:hypothetical protein